MKINKDSLKARANNISKELSISQNVVYSRFFYDAFLSRLSKSKYKDRFVLKGGLYLSSILGIDTRSTMDIDFYIRKISMEKEKIIEIMKQIISADFDDGIVFAIIDVDGIRDEDRYGGYQITMLGKLDNVRCQFGIDVATGDPIVPSDRKYNYECLVTKEVLSLKAYSLESVIAEKLETILARRISNSRSKDYYDLYILRKSQLAKIDKTILERAFIETCNYRNFSITKYDALALIDEISLNEEVRKRWINYCNNVKYTGTLELNEVLVSVREWINDIFSDKDKNGDIEISKNPL